MVVPGTSKCPGHDLFAAIAFIEPVRWLPQSAKGFASSQLRLGIASSSLVSWAKEPGVNLPVGTTVVIIVIINIMV